MTSPNAPARPICRAARLPFAVLRRLAQRRDALLRNRRLPALAALTATAAIASASGCIAVGGARHQDTPTLGKQLIDLKAAYDGGAMTEAEYNAAKSQLLSGK